LDKNLKSKKSKLQQNVKGLGAGKLNGSSKSKLKTIAEELKCRKSKFRSQQAQL